MFFLFFLYHKPAFRYFLRFVNINEFAFKSNPSGCGPKLMICMSQWDISSRTCIQLVQLDLAGDGAG